MNNKPRSQDKQTNVIVIKQHNLSKPQSANVAYGLRNTFKKENNVVNSKHSLSSSNSTKHHPKSCNVAQQQRNQSKQKQFINKNDNIMSLRGSHNKRNVPQITKRSINTNISCSNNNHNKHTKPVSNNKCNRQGVKILNNKHKVNNKGKCNNNSRSNIKANGRGDIKTQSKENILMK